MRPRAPLGMGIAAALMAAALAACTLARPTPEMHYYVPSMGGDLRPLGCAIRIGDFAVDPPYATERIAYRASRYRLGYYTYHRWAAAPQRLLAMAVRDYLGAGTASAGGPVVEISGRVRRIEEVDDPSGWRGALTLDLTARRGGEVIIDGSYAESEPASAESPEAVVAALSHALQKILERFAADLSAALGESPPAGGALPRGD